MKLFNFKKALAIVSNLFTLILFVIAVGFTTIFVNAVCSFVVAEAASIPSDIEDELIIIPRFYNSEDCFAYQDKLGRVHTKVIDSDKFIQENMNSCFPVSDVGYAFSLSLKVKDTSTDLNLDTITTFNWIEGPETKRIIEEVFVLDDGVKYNSELIIGIKNVE
jgi:hypothetical protein|tara:strand:- start:5530 stop:6018 length:489 start_codon:yes stop_codon:yes gene_type:complete